MINLSGKVALITGASRGIGAAAAKTLAGYGATAVLTARSEPDIRKNAAAIASTGGNADYRACDVSQYDGVTDAVQQCVEKHGSIDILVNNAGAIEPISHLAESDPDIWCQAIDINLKGVYFGMRAAIPIMEKQGGGTIINLSSGAATSAIEGWSHYCSSKAAARMLTECGHAEYHEKGIRVVGLSPGTVATDMQATINQSGVNPVSQLDWSVHISPDWVAETIAFLCTRAADQFCGTDFSLKTEEGRRLVGLI